MGIGDSGILAVGQSVEETTKEMLAQLVDEDTELISPCIMVRMYRRRVQRTLHRRLKIYIRM